MAHGRENGRGYHHDHVDSGLIGVLRGLCAPHSHDAKDSLDQALEGSRDGIRAVAISLVILLLTAGIQALVVVASGSVALLGDTLHNAADALTAVPLWVAFRLGRRVPTSRFTYGYGKAEDVAGVVVLALIFGSAAFAGYEAIYRLVHPEKVTHLGIVMAAAVVGGVGNEVVAHTASESGAASAQQHWRQTASTPVLTESLLCWSSLVPSPWRSGPSGLTPWSA